MNIYVGNLSFEVTEEDLRLAFEPFGQVESDVKTTDIGNITTCPPKLRFSICRNLAMG
jgi:RNA recognition motif-containing protein